MQTIEGYSEECDGSVPPPSPAEGLPEALAAGVALCNGQFRITQQIGAGGFGITYLADDVALQRKVVIKECYADGFCQRDDDGVTVNAPQFETRFAQIVQLFMQEARSIAMLRHPNIVTVHQVFAENGTAYMVLDLVEGRDLAEIMDSDDEKLEPDQIHGILVKMLDAVDVVHHAGLLHRDISPDNILLDRWGSPILIDFGAARNDAAAGSDQPTAILAVKDGYSPVEFYTAGTEHFAASDLYSLGATLYHLITGDAPPDSQARETALDAGENDPYEPLIDRFADYDPVLLSTIDDVMQLDPSSRIQSAREWAQRIADEQRKVRVQKRSGALTRSDLSALVAATNQEVQRGGSSRPRTVILELPPTEKPIERPVWADEFNLETAERANAPVVHLQTASVQITTQEPSKHVPQQQVSLTASVLKWCAATASRTASRPS